MAMSAKHFEVIAGVVREHGGDRRAALAEAFAFELRKENPRFDRDRFVAACTAGPGKDCDECEEEIPDSAPDMVNAHHAATCSLHPDNVTD